MQKDLENALKALEQAAQEHCSIMFGDFLEIDQKGDIKSRIEQVTKYLRGTI